MMRHIHRNQLSTLKIDQVPLVQDQGACIIFRGKRQLMLSNCGLGWMEATILRSDVALDNPSAPVLVHWQWCRMGTGLR